MRAFGKGHQMDGAHEAPGISSEEAGRISGLAGRKITHLLRQGRLAGRRQGPRWVVFADSLERQLASHSSSRRTRSPKPPPQAPALHDQAMQLVQKGRHGEAESL